MEQPPTPFISAKPEPRELAHLACIALIAIGFVVMLVRDLFADIPLARTGIALLTGLALLGFYFTKKKE